MNVGELIEELKKQDPELPVFVGIGCSCYGSAEAGEVLVFEQETMYVPSPKRVFISE